MAKNEKHIKTEIPSLTDKAHRDETTDERVITGTMRESDTDDDGNPVVRVRGFSYTAQDCIADINELAGAFPDRRITRDFFRQQGSIPEAAWTGHFGNWPEFLRQAGLEHTRHANKIKNQAAKHAAVDEMRKITMQRRDLDKVYERTNSKRWKTMIAFSDLHDEECDPFYLRMLYDTLKDVQPDVICMNGDIFDCPEFGKYSTDPRDWDVVGRIKAGLKIVENVRAACPEAQIDFIEGNHEARVVKHLVECSEPMKH